MVKIYCEAKILLAALAVPPIQVVLANKLNGQKLTSPQTSWPVETSAKTLFVLSIKISTDFSKKDHCKLSQLESTSK